jgi:hypothetical protein
MPRATLNVMLLTYSYAPAVGGVETIVEELTHALVDAGHRALVVTNAPVRAFAFEPGPVPVLRLRIPSQFPAGPRERIRTALRNAFNIGVLVPVALAFRADVTSCHFITMDTVYARCAGRARRTPRRRRRRARAFRERERLSG